MNNKTTPFICVFIVLFCIVSMSMLVFADESYAEMPDYQGLSPITSIVNAPMSIAIANNGKIYVSESINNRLLVYSQSHEYQEALLGLSKPISVFVDNNGIIYICNKGRSNVEVYDENYNLLLKLGSGNGEFNQPNDVAVDKSGNIYVVDLKDHVVKVYSPVIIDEFGFASGGSFSHIIGSHGNDDGQFHKPSSIEIIETEDAIEKIIVLDHQVTLDPYSVAIDGARIQFLDLSGTYLSGFTRYGMEVGEMFRPEHFTVDSNNRIYVTDAYLSVVLVYEEDGTFIGLVYDLDYPLRTPVGITIGSSNKLYIASLTSRRINVFGILPYSDMYISPSSLSFDGQRGSSPPPLQSAEIINDGSETLNWTASTAYGWITLSDTSGSAASSASSIINVGINTEGLISGLHTGSISITTDTGAVEVVSVSLNLTDSILIANPGGIYTAYEGQSVLLDASNSSGAIDLFEWDIDNNSSFEYDSPLPTQTHIFQQEGTYLVRLRVTDDLGVSANALTSAQIADAIPTSDFDGDPTNGTAPLTVNFVNSSSGYDVPLTYEWDFDDDGITDSTAENPSYIFSVGTHTVKLTVTDSDGSIDTLTRIGYITVDGECASMIARVGESNQSLLQDAYNTAEYGATIKSQAVTITENLTMGGDKLVVLEGGHNCDYSGVVGATVINGDVTISSGTIVIGDFVIGE